MKSIAWPNCSHHHLALCAGLYTLFTTTSLPVLKVLHTINALAIPVLCVCRSYLLSVSSVESLVVPLLHTLHCAPQLSSHHVYMALIVILILTEDTAFNAALHDIPLPAVPWWDLRALYFVWTWLLQWIISSYHHGIKRRSDSLFGPDFYSESFLAIFMGLRGGRIRYLDLTLTVNHF